MAVSTKWWRRIVVDGVVYDLRFPRRQRYAEEYGLAVHEVAVRRGDRGNAVLRLFISRRCPVSGLDWFHRACSVSGIIAQRSGLSWGRYTVAETTLELPEPPGSELPSDVACGMREAIAAGWRADLPGPKFAHSIYKPAAGIAGDVASSDATTESHSTSTAPRE